MAEFKILAEVRESAIVSVEASSCEAAETLVEEMLLQNVLRFLKPNRRVFASHLPQLQTAIATVTPPAGASA